MSNPFGSQHGDLNQRSEVVYMPTEEAYARWASVYDTDGNFLQATDDWELETRLPRFLTLAGLQSDASHNTAKTSSAEPKTIIDLGCGTGRNTYKIRALTNSEDTTVIGLDSSQEMLDIARQKSGSDESMQSPRFTRFDINDPTRTFETATTPNDIATAFTTVFSSHLNVPKADAIISTLVIEHLEAEQYFAVASELLKANGILFLTNMHSDMGKVSQAGFVDESGVKVRPKSIPHTVAEISDGAKRHGFEVLDVAERQIREEDVRRLGPRSKKWIGVKCWFCISFRKV